MIDQRGFFICYDQPLNSQIEIHTELRNFDGTIITNTNFELYVVLECTEVVYEMEKLFGPGSQTLMEHPMMRKDMRNLRQ